MKAGAVCTHFSQQCAPQLAKCLEPDQAKASVCMIGPAVEANGDVVPRTAALCHMRVRQATARGHEASLRALIPTRGAVRHLRIAYRTACEPRN